MHYSSGNYEAFVRPRKPERADKVTAWFVGSGLAGLAGAAFLIRDGGVAGDKITILEELAIPGGALDGLKVPEKGFVIRGGREMEEHFECLWDLYRSIPSLEIDGASVLDEFYRLNKDDPNFSLQRARVPASEISTLVEIMQPVEGAAGRTGSEPNPVEVLRSTPIFRLLDDPALFELGAGMHHLSFAPGEHIARQGEAGDSMFIVTAGEVSIQFSSAAEGEGQVGLIGPGDFFGETSLLTGEPRNASAIAISRVDCYRLDKAGLEGIMAGHPDLAEDMSVVMAHRQIEHDMVREKLGMEAARLREAESGQQMLMRIRKFFGLHDEEEMH